MNATVPTSPADALGRIVRQYSEVTERLKHSHDQLQLTVQSLRNDLAEKNRELERRNRLAALGEMAAGMAHEIRNPLGGIQLYASLLARDLAGQPDSLALVNKISAGVTHLERLVSQVLQFTGEMTAHRAWVDAAEVIDQAVELARPAFAALHVKCHAEGPRPLMMSVDPRLLGQAALNLLLNGAEAAGGEAGEAAEAGDARDAGACVVVRWSAAGEAKKMKLCVADNGPGIPAGLVDKIFNPFFTTKETGTGLGLAIVHRIVEAHDGAVSVRNGHEKGAEFELTL
jgi:signal transduction histidine kinase